MTVMQKEDEVGQVPSRNKLSLSLSRRDAVSGKDGIVDLYKQVSYILRKGTTDSVYPTKRKIDGCNILPTNKKTNIGFNMLNGYRSGDGYHRVTDESSNNESLPVATLSNMGNTCYLNSVLYTLRFTPAFLHNLHHLVADLALMHLKLNQIKAKSSSLGRNISSISGPSNRSSSSKDLLSLSNSQNDIHPKSKVQIATEKLHELYMSLHSLEMKENGDPYQPASFLQALIDVNSIYQGNQQQDAHELLIYLLDILRETCDLLAKQSQQHTELQADSLSEAAAQPAASALSTGKSWGVRRSWKKNKEAATKKSDKASKEKPARVTEEQVTNGAGPAEPEEQPFGEAGAGPDDRLPKKAAGFNFVSEDFGGVTLRRTKCLECECVTERKEPFYDICVPISLDLERSANELYRSLCVTTENLRDTNKYWCERCVRYNEASREVSFERLPNLLVLHLKRFSTTAAGTEKMNNYMPTLLVLACFCDQCAHLPDERKLHSYQLYGVIMHLGSTMASGHYIAYTRASNHHQDYAACCRESPKNVSFCSGPPERTINFLKFLKPKSTGSDGPNKASALNGLAGCKSMDCCGIKLSKSVIENALNSSARDPKHAHNNEGSTGAAGPDDGLWLECDDDVVRTLTTKDFLKLLSCKRTSPATPYLLFYSKKDSATTNMVID